MASEIEDNKNTLETDEFQLISENTDSESKENLTVLLEKWRNENVKFVVFCKDQNIN